MHTVDFSTANGDLASESALLTGDFLSGFLRQEYQLLGTVFEQQSLWGEVNAAPATPEQRDPQFSLQLHQLSGQSGLGDVQQRCGLGDIFLSGDHEEIV